jgi:hypothetical protein
MLRNVSQQGTSLNYQSTVLKAGKAAPSRILRKATVLHAATAVNQPFQVLQDWLESVGGSANAIAVEECQMGSVIVRGLVAQQQLPSGTSVLSVPISHTLRDDKAPPAYPGAPWNASLAAYLLTERNKGSSSGMWPYLCTLPADGSSSPLLLPADMIQEVQYPPAIAALHAFQDFARDSYEKWQQQQQQQQHSWTDWCWALHMVQSRSIRLAITGCKVMIPGKARSNMQLLLAAIDCTTALGPLHWASTSSGKRERPVYQQAGVVGDADSGALVHWLASVTHHVLQASMSSDWCL